MTTLKFDHALADLIRSGQKTATWRIYDDKGISVNDQITLIDKVDPANPDSWVPIGTATVHKIIEKRLGEITSEDYTEHERFASTDEILTTYKKYYGPNVTTKTPVRMVHFTVNDDEITADDQQEQLIQQEIKLYADGGSRGNPGPSASGYVLLSMKDEVAVENGVYLGITTNNQAEYQALRLGLEAAIAYGAREVHVYMDSLLVINQMLGIFKVKNRDLWPIHAAIKELLPHFKRVTFAHVPRERNKLADAQVNVALDKQAGR